MAKRKRLTPVPMGQEGDAPPVHAAAPPTDLPLPRGPAPIASAVGAAASEAALARMAQHMSEAREAGRLVLELPLDAIVEDHLTRDRIALDAHEMTTLIDSIRNRGQQTPIEVMPLGPDGVAEAGAEADSAQRYGLISGWRRLAALRHLREATGGAQGDTGYDKVLAVLRYPATAGEAYVAMVEENEIRASLSHYERARIVAQAVARGVYADTRLALRKLFGTASRSRRSKIGSFLVLVEALDDVLAFPTALSERLGLTLAKRLEADPGFAGVLRDALTPPAESAEAEQAVLKAALASSRPASVRPDPPRKAGPGIVYVSEKDDGSLSLSGPGVTTTFRSDLIAWLEARDAALGGDSGSDSDTPPPHPG